MRKRKGFTLIELLVVIAIIALLLSILMPSLNRVKKQAKSVACQGQLKQWALIFAMYTNDNDGYFHYRELGTDAGYQKMWPQYYQSYYKDPMMRCCPAARNPNVNFGPYSTWGVALGTAQDSDWGWGGSWVPKEGYFGSYGMNRYMLNRPEKEYWRKTGVKNADKIPVFLDCMYVAIDPDSTDPPPEYNGDRSSQIEMKFSCIDRHLGSINGLLLDWSAGKIDLKQLWTLRWSRTFDYAGPWTKAGNVRPEDWPEWMKTFKDY